MEIRVLEYFLTIVEEKNITRAAERLHISQSTLSRQIKDMEDDLGVTLFERGKREITLTEEGYFLYERARDITQLTSDTESHLMAGQTISGTLRIGLSEGTVGDYLLPAVKDILDEHSDVLLDYQTLNADSIYQDIDRGLLDFGVVWTNDSLPQYNSLLLPVEDVWGALFLKSDKLAQKEQLIAKDLSHRNLLLPRQLDANSSLQQYLREYVEDARVVATYDMNYNLMRLVEAGLGVALTFDKPEFIRHPKLAFRKLQYLSPVATKLIWKQNRRQTRLDSLFLEKVREQLG